MVPLKRESNLDSPADLKCSHPTQYGTVEERESNLDSPADLKCSHPTQYGTVEERESNLDSPADLKCSHPTQYGTVEERERVILIHLLISNAVTPHNMVPLKREWLLL